MREKLEVLENHADVATQFGQIGLRVADTDAVNKDFSFLKRL